MFNLRTQKLLLQQSDLLGRSLGDIGHFDALGEGFLFFGHFVGFSNKTVDNV